MNKDEQLRRHLDLCKAVYEHLKKTGKWPWPDSTMSENMVESEGNSKDP